MGKGISKSFLKETVIQWRSEGGELSKGERVSWKRKQCVQRPCGGL